MYFHFECMCAAGRTFKRNTAMVMKWSLLIGLFVLTKAGVTGNNVKSIQ